MIAPTNCNRDCDCAQRHVRCQKAPPPYVIPASLARDEILAELERQNALAEVGKPHGGPLA